MAFPLGAKSGEGELPDLPNASLPMPYLML